jgi:integrase
MQYKDWLAKWFELYIKPSVKESTCKKYSSQIQNHIIPALGDKNLDELDAVTLQSFTVNLRKSHLAANTICGVISLVKMSLKMALKVGVVDKEFSDCIVMPKKDEKKIECFTEAEQKRIERFVLTSGDKRLFGIVLTLYTGLRIGELLAARWQDIDFKKGVLYVRYTCRDSWQNGQYVKILDTPKTEKSVRVIPLPKQLLPTLKQIKMLSHCEYVVPSQGQFGAQVRSYQRTFSRLLNWLKIPHKGFHSLRHTFATRAIECGMDVKTLSEILGHSNPMVTLSRYAHSNSDYKAQMMNKLGKLLD